MTRPRPKPTAPPLAATLRQALAQGWHTLDALEALAGRATGARLRVHAALGELRGAGCALEERVERGVAEVRELPPVADGATCPACKAVVREHDDHHGWCAVGIRDCGWWAARGAVRLATPADIADTDARFGGAASAFLDGAPMAEVAARAMGAGATTYQAPRSPPVEGEPVDAASYYLGRGREEEDADLDAVRAARGRALRERVIASLPPGATPREIMFAEAAEIVRMRGPAEPATALDAPVPPCEVAAPVALTLPAPRPDDGTGDLDADDREAARVAIAEEEAALGEAEGEDARAHCSPRGKPKAETIARVAAALDAAPPKPPGPGSRCARPGCGKRFDQHGAPRGTVCPFLAKPRGRPRVAPAAPSPALDAPAVEPPPCPPCVDCGEESGTCPEGRCRDCDLEHGMSAGACRECHTWIIREDVGGPLAKQHAKGCSLADSDDWHPRNAAEYAAVRTARYGWAPEPRRGCEREFPIVRVAPIVIAAPRPVGRCRPPACHADDIHVPSAVRDFARPLCERHRAWVEGAGGTVAAGGLAGVLP